MFLRFTACLILLLTACSLSGQEVSTLLTDPARQFAAMHWHEDGRIYSVDYFQGKLYQIYLDGTVETLVGEGFQNLSGGGFDNEGNFYFSDIEGGRILRLNDDNSYTEVGSGFQMPVALRASPTNNDTVFISEFEGHKITKLSLSTGEKVPFVTRGGILGPDAIIPGWRDELIVSNWTNHKIHTVSPRGEVSLFATVPGENFMGYVDRIGDYLYVPSYSNRKLYRIDREGNVTLIAGTGGDPGFADGPGDQATFGSPNGTCHSPSGDTLLVADHQSIRIITDFEPSTSTPTTTLAFNWFQLSPNPATNFLRLEMDLPQADSLDWAVFDAGGRQQAKGKFPPLAAGEQQLQIPVDKLKAGTYTIRLTNQEGRSSSFTFLKI